jgi:hypothetical protein
MPYVMFVGSSAGRFQDHQIPIDHGLARQDGVMVVVNGGDGFSCRSMDEAGTPMMHHTDPRRIFSGQ